MTTVRMEPDLREWLVERAHRNKRSVSAEVTMILENERGAETEASKQ